MMLSGLLEEEVSLQGVGVGCITPCSLVDHCYG